MKSDLHYMMDLEMQSATIERLKPQASPFLRLMKLFLASIGIIFCVIWYQCSKTETYDKINSTWDLLTLHKRLSEEIHWKHSIPMAAQLFMDIFQSKTGLKYSAPPVLQLEKVETSAGHFNGRSSVSEVKSMMHRRRLSLLYPQEPNAQIPIALEADFALTEARVTPYVIIPEIAPIVNTDNSSIELMTDITLSDAPTTTTTMIDQLPSILDSAPQQLLEIKDATGVEDVQGMPAVLDRTALNAEGVRQQELLLNPIDHQIPIALEADFALTEARVTPYVIIPEIAPIVNTDNSSIELMTDITLSDAPTTTTTMIDQLPSILDSAPQQLLEIKDATGVEDVQGMPAVLDRTALNAEGVQQQYLQNAEPLSSVPLPRTTPETLNDIALEYLEI